MQKSSERPTYKERYDHDKAGFNNKCRDGDTGWYCDVVGEDNHFERSILDMAAKSGPLVVERLLLLNAYEHIAVMEWARAMRKLDYTDYFGRRDLSFSVCFGFVFLNGVFL